MAIAIVNARRAVPDDEHERLAAFGRRVLDRINSTPISGLTNRTAGAVWVDLLREARRFDLLDDDYGGNFP